MNVFETVRESGITARQMAEHYIPVAANEITDEAELLEFMANWEKANVGNK